MQVRYGANPKDFKYYDTKEIRDELLIEDIFKEDEINLTYSHIDRIIFGKINVFLISRERYLASLRERERGPRQCIFLLCLVEGAPSRNQSQIHCQQGV